jgi:hypothetical protein
LPRKMFYIGFVNRRENSWRGMAVCKTTDLAVLDRKRPEAEEVALKTLLDWYARFGISKQNTSERTAR